MQFALTFTPGETYYVLMKRNGYRTCTFTRQGWTYTHNDIENTVPLTDALWVRNPVTLEKLGGAAMGQTQLWRTARRTEVYKVKFLAARGHSPVGMGNWRFEVSAIGYGAKEILEITGMYTYAERVAREYAVNTGYNVVTVLP